MTPLQRWALGGGLVLAALAGAFVAGLTVDQHRAAAKAASSQTQSDQHEGAAQTHAGQAVADHQQGAAADAATTTAEAKVATAKRDLGNARARLHPKVPFSSAPAHGEPLPALPSSSAESEAALILAKQDAVIAAQDEQIRALQASLVAAKAEATQWQQAYEESQKALALQKLAQEAAVRSDHAQGLKAQLVRGLEGLALGYAAGRLQR